MSATRRQLLGRGIGVAGTASLAALPASLTGAATAFAQESDETDALERLVELEQAAELAYSLAVEDGKLKKRTSAALEAFGAFAGDHATALGEALEQLGVEEPDAKSDPADYDSLKGFDASAAEAKVLKFLIGLEAELIAAYEAETHELESDDLVRTGAQIGAAHAQVFVALRVLAGDGGSALAKLPAPSTSATASDPEDSSSEDE